MHPKNPDLNVLTSNGPFQYPVLPVRHVTRLLLNVKAELLTLKALNRPLTFLPLNPLPHYFSSLLASFPLSTGLSLEQKPQGGSGLLCSSNSQITPAVETTSPSSLSPASAHVLCGPPPSSQPHISQTALVSPGDQSAGTDSKKQQ